jgi:hypothetical protein
MAVRIIGPKTTNINAVVNQRIYPIVFGALEFSNAVQYTSLQGPFSMAININNISGYDVYIGVDIQTREQNIVLADRKTLIFCPYNTAITLSGASVPALANVMGEVISVTVTIYRMNFLTGGITNTNIIVSLFLDEPFVATAPSPYIGIDSVALMPGKYLHTSTGGFTTLFANTPDQAMCDVTASLIYRNRLLSIRLTTRVTPYPGDLEVYAQVSSPSAGVSELLRIYSEPDHIVTEVYSEPIIIRNGDSIEVLGTNNNAANDYEASAVIGYELVL